jgi:hypothetical protein
MRGLLIGWRLLPLPNESGNGLVVKSTLPAWFNLRVPISSPDVSSSLGDAASLSGERLPSLSLDVDDGGVGGNEKLATFFRKQYQIQQADEMVIHSTQKAVHTNTLTNSFLKISFFLSCFFTLFFPVWQYGICR